jgi:ferredoxin
MAIITSRAKENAAIKINYEKCDACGICVTICKDFSLIIENGKLVVCPNPLFGCMACGQCAAVCPFGAIEIEGREMSAKDIFAFPNEHKKTGYDELLKLMYERRSIRDFKEKEIEQEKIDKIIEAASTSPMGIPPSDVGLLVLKGKEKVNEFSKDFLNYLEYIKFITNPVYLALMRPFYGKENTEMMKCFIKPLINKFIETNKKGENYLLYSAPLAIYFYSSPYSDSVDAYIPATYSMLAAESLGLGTCMIGSVDPFIKKGAKKFKEKYGLPPKHNGGLIVIYGYSKYKFHKGIKRTFAKVHYY